MSQGSADTKPGGGGEEQLYDGHGRYLGTAGPGGNEVRGKVSPPLKAKIPAVVIWKHPREQQGLKPQMRDVVEDMRKVPEADSVFISSGHRAPMTNGDPHADGRAVDVSRINGIPVEDLETANGQEADKARRAAANLEEKLKNNPDVNQIIGPNGGWNKDGREWRPIRDAKLLKEHEDHYHINVFRK